MPNRTVKFAFFAALVAFILWFISKLRSVEFNSPFDFED